jgi:hypothetical protein
MAAGKDGVIAVAYQDGSYMTMATKFTERAQMAEARGLVEEANEGIRKGQPLARLVRIKIIEV